MPYDFALDREMWRWAPDEVNLFVTRTPHLLLHADAEMARRISSDRAVRDGTRNVLAAEPDVVVYLCTSGSFVRGVTGERRIRTVMRRAGAPEAVTTSGALLDALAHLDVRDLAVASPYLAEVAGLLDSYLAEAGVHVLTHRHLGLADHIWRLPRRTVRDLVLSADHDAAAAVFVSCTNVPTFDLIPELEDLLGKPVLSANQVSLWAALRAARVATPEVGQHLFAGPAPSDAS